VNSWKPGSDSRSSLTGGIGRPPRFDLQP